MFNAREWHMLWIMWYFLINRVLLYELITATADTDVSHTPFPSPYWVTLFDALIFFVPITYVHWLHAVL